MMIGSVDQYHQRILTRRAVVVQDADIFPVGAPCAPGGPVRIHCDGDVELVEVSAFDDQPAAPGRLQRAGVGDSL